MTLLTVEEAAQVAGQGERFVRRLIAEWRILYLKLGKHVRITDVSGWCRSGDPVPISTHSPK